MTAAEYQRRNAERQTKRAKIARERYRLYLASLPRSVPGKARPSKKVDPIFIQKPQAGSLRCLGRGPRPRDIIDFQYHGAWFWEGWR